MPRSRGTSTPTSFPSRLTTSPATRTVRTFDALACVTTAPTGFAGAIMFSRSPPGPTTITSACLPGVSDPIRSSMPSAAAPPVVAQPIASRTL